MKASPNMALQRTRGLAAAQFLPFAGRGWAVKALSGRRSPLNAHSFGGGEATAMSGRTVNVLGRKQHEV